MNNKTNVPPTPVLDTVKSPSDLEYLSSSELNKLRDELRQFIMATVEQTTGGHLASNLGAVELTLALHRVFKSPADKIIWDVGHQCYTHKLLTGRKESFHTLRQKGGLSGFPKPSESVHDIVETGHSSTSISAALGLLCGQQLQGNKSRVIAVIGDGALTGGMAFEALNNAGHLKKNLMVVLNDNEMSIHSNVGAFSSHLSRLTSKHKYLVFRRTFDGIVKRIPFFGKPLLAGIYRLKRAMKALFYKENIFTDLGFKYIGPLDGHNMTELERTFLSAKEIDRPVLFHVITKKGRGHSEAEQNPAAFHGVKPPARGFQSKAVSFTGSFSRHLIARAEKDSRIVAITAAMASGTGLEEFRNRFSSRFFDVGITEQHAVTFAAGLALSGLKPVVSIYSTFMQRAVDQVIHDVAIPGLPVVFTLDRAGLVPGDGETHQGIFDPALFKSVPGLVMLAPATDEETGLMLDYAFSLKQPSMIRYAKDNCPVLPNKAEPLVSGQGVFVVKNEQKADILFVTYGSLVANAVEAAATLTEKETLVDVFNLRFLKPIDEDYLVKALENYSLVIVFEEVPRRGGLGEDISLMLSSRKGQTAVHVHGLEEEFPVHATRSELLALYRLDAPGMMSRVDDALYDLKIRKVVESIRNNDYKPQAL